MRNTFGVEGSSVGKFGVFRMALLSGGLALLIGGCTIAPLTLTTVAPGPQGLALIIDSQGSYSLFAGPGVEGVTIFGKSFEEGQAYVFVTI